MLSDYFLNLIQDKDFIYKFQNSYPDKNPYILDYDVLNNLNINQDDKINNKINNKLNQNIIMGNEIIPEMQIETDLIYLNGKINGNQIRILLDTGASSCVIFKSLIDKYNLDYLVDKENIAMVQGPNQINKTYGKIWFLDIELEISKNNYISVPIAVNIIDDYEIIQQKKILKDYDQNLSNSITNNILEYNYYDDKLHEFELILGMGFLKSYKANIDFNLMNITLNNNIKIKF